MNSAAGGKGRRSAVGGRRQRAGPAAQSALVWLTGVDEVGWVGGGGVRGESVKGAEAAGAPPHPPRPPPGLIDLGVWVSSRPRGARLESSKYGVLITGRGVGGGGGAGQGGQEGTPAAAAAPGARAIGPRGGNGPAAAPRREPAARPWLEHPRPAPTQPPLAGNASERRLRLIVTAARAAGAALAVSADTHE